MKKLTAMFLALMMGILGCAACLAEGELVGGWTVTEETAVTEEAALALEKALTDHVGAKIEPVALLATQVVAGVNYCLLCRVTPVVPDPVAHWTLVWVYAGVNGGAEILAMQDLSVLPPEVLIEE